MNRINATVLVLLMSACIASQDLPSPEIYFGAKGGVAASQVGFTPYVSQSFSLGATGGVMFRYIAEKYLGLQAELNFSQAGWHEKPPGTFRRTLNYVDVPFLTHIYMGNKTRFFVNLGPSVSFMIAQKASGLPGTDAPQEQQTQKPQRTFDYGFALGTGLSVPFKQNAIQIEIRGYYGMNDIYNNKKTDYFQKSNNIKVSATIGYTFKYK